MQKERIIQASTEEFMRLGVKSVSMDDISSKLGISKKTLYKAVENKEDLVTQSIATFLRLERQLIENIAANANDAIHEMIQIGEHRVMTLRNMKPSVVHDLKKYYKKVCPEEHHQNPCPACLHVCFHALCHATSCLFSCPSCPCTHACPSASTLGRAVGGPTAMRPTAMRAMRDCCG